MSVEEPYRTSYIIDRSYLDQRQDYQKEGQRPQIEDEYLLMLGEPSEFLRKP